MTRANRIFVAFILLGSLFGCTKEEDYLSVFREQQKARQDIAEILGTVRDEKSMADAKEKLDGMSEKCAAIAKRASALPAPSRKVQERLMQEREYVQQTMDDLKREVGRIQQLPGGPEFIRQFVSNQPGLMGAIR